MVLVGVAGLLTCAAGYWVAVQMQTCCNHSVCIVICGFIFAVSVLFIGYGFYYGNVTHMQTFDVPVLSPN
jgi:hypothetical protein